MANDDEQHWNAAGYAHHARFVAELGRPLIGLLDPKPGESILDLGCGDGVLTTEIQRLGARVNGVDRAEAMVDAARKLGIDARLMNAQTPDLSERFDAVFSNAALHWRFAAHHLQQDRLEVAIGEEATALKFWEQTGEYESIRRMPGFIATWLDKALAPDARFTYVDIAEWKPAETTPSAPLGLRPISTVRDSRLRPLKHRRCWPDDRIHRNPPPALTHARFPPTERRACLGATRGPRQAVAHYCQKR